MKKIALLLCAVLTAGALTACSGGADATTAVSQTAAQEAADKGQVRMRRRPRRQALRRSQMKQERIPRTLPQRIHFPAKP